MDKEKISVDSATLRFLYKKYKEFIVPFIVYFVCTVLLIVVLVPQFKNIIDALKQAKNIDKNLEVLKNNFNLLSTLNDEVLDSQLKTVSTALPSNKDFIGIISAISYAAAATDVRLSDFKFSIGELNDEDQDLNKLPFLSTNLSIIGDIEDANRFIDVLYTTLPLSEVMGVNSGPTSSEISVNFYYKAFPSTKENKVSPIDLVSSEELALINKLSQFNYGIFEQLDFGEEVSSQDL